ncbi:MAG: RNase P subunit [archaeon]|nr:MAG: RNase P subunit [archaeon]
MKPQRKDREGAAAVVRLLTESAVRLSSSDPELAKAQAALARKLRLRFNIRLDPSLRRFACRGCKGILVPGVNARVRLGHGKPPILRVTCSDCGHVNRKSLGMP